MDQLWQLISSQQWLGYLALLGALGFLFYRLADTLQIFHVARVDKPEDLKQLSDQAYAKKKQRKQKRSQHGLFKGIMSWLIQLAYIVAAIPWLVAFFYDTGLSSGLIYFILIVLTFIVNLASSKMLSLWTPTQVFLDYPLQHQPAWKPSNLFWQAWGISTWAVPTYFFWSFFEVQGWIGSVVFLFVGQIVQIYIFIYMIKRQVVPYQEYAGLSDQLKSNLQEYLAKQQIADNEVGILPQRMMGPNAFASGFFGYQQIVLTKELIEGYQDPHNPDFTLQLNDNTIESIVAHEVGHVRHRHILNSLLLGTTVSSLVTIAVYHLFSGDPKQYVLFASETSQQIMLYWGQSIFNVMLTFILNFIMMGNSRRNEYQADTFMLKTNPCKDGHEFFHQIRHIAPVKNQPLWHRCYMTHPAPKKREERIRQWDEEHCNPT